MTYTGTYTHPFWSCTYPHPARPTRCPLKRPTRVPTRPTRGGTYTLPRGFIYPRQCVPRSIQDQQPGRNYDRYWLSRTPGFSSCSTPHLFRRIRRLYRSAGRSYAMLLRPRGIRSMRCKCGQQGTPITCLPCLTCLTFHPFHTCHLAIDNSDRKTGNEAGRAALGRVAPNRVVRQRPLRSVLHLHRDWLSRTHIWCKRGPCDGSRGRTDAAIAAIGASSGCHAFDQACLRLLDHAEVLLELANASPVVTT